MSISDKIRKTVLILKPFFNVPANRCAIRTLLIDSGFIIVREEERLIVGDIKNAIFGSSNKSSSSSAENDKECSIYVVARENAVDTLRQLLQDKDLTDADAVTPHDDASAAATLTLLFPRMKKDLIPSNDTSSEYLDKELKALLVKGFTELAKSKPQNPVEAMAHWLLENNPNRGSTQKP
jgi:hypothetical protein